MSNPFLFMLNVAKVDALKELSGICKSKKQNWSFSFFDENESNVQSNGHFTLLTKKELFKGT